MATPRTKALDGATEVLIEVCILFKYLENIRYGENWGETVNIKC